MRAPPRATTPSGSHDHWPGEAPQWRFAPACGHIVKVIEVLSESPKSWEEASQSVVAEASKTLRNIRSVYIKEFSASVDGKKITSYRVNAKVTFEMERGGQEKR